MRIIVGVTGATGVEMSYYLLKALRSTKDCEIHLVVSQGALTTWQLESRIPLQDLYDLADYVYKETNLSAVISSGSYMTDGMIVMPCSMKTLAGIVSGYAENLIQRAADVPREMPLGRIHLKNLNMAAEYGCAIVPPMLTFYNGASTLEDQIHHVVGKVLLQFGLSYDKFVAWKGDVVS